MHVQMLKILVLKYKTFKAKKKLNAQLDKNIPIATYETFAQKRV